MWIFQKYGTNELIYKTEKNYRCRKPFRVIEWKSFSHVQLFSTPWTIACQAPMSRNSPGKNTGVSSCFLLQRIFPTQGLNPGLPTLQADRSPSEPPGKPKNTGVGSLSLLQRIFLTQEYELGSPALQADSLPTDLFTTIRHKLLAAFIFITYSYPCISHRSTALAHFHVFLLSKSYPSSYFTISHYPVCSVSPNIPSPGDPFRLPHTLHSHVMPTLLFPSAYRSVVLNLDCN